MSMSALGSPERPLRAAIVGSGPAGFYAVAALFNAPINVQADVIERLPTPYGLVRAAVAPDHPKTRTVIKVFDKLAEREGFSFLGNVQVGRDISVQELRAHYDVVIFATGAEVPADLGIPGEDLLGSHAADEFAEWYNGHPDFRDSRFDFSHETAVVIGQGNVATDVVRMLVRPTDELRSTDITQYALDALAESRVREVFLIGRRGPVQARFTQQELQELGELPDCDVVLDPADLVLDPVSQAELDDPKNFNSKRNMAVFEDFAKRRAPAVGSRPSATAVEQELDPTRSKNKRLYIRFLRSPVEIRGHERVESLVLERNRLEGEPFRLKARGTGVIETLSCGLIFRAVGHRGIRMPGVPFDEARGTFPNQGGRILQNGKPVPGLYAVGWIKRGPTGLIGTNKADGIETIGCVLADLPLIAPCPVRDSAPLHALLSSRGIRVVSYDDWRRIDAAEVARGEVKGKPRDKLTTFNELLASATPTNEGG